MPSPIPDEPASAEGSPGARHVPRPLIWVGLIVGVLAVSTSSILIRVAEAEELALAFWRCAAGAVALAPFALNQRRPLGRSYTRSYLGAGVLLALHFAAFITSLSYTTVASAAVLVTMSPLFVGAGAAIFLRESPARTTWIGIGIAVVGAVGIALADLAGGGGGREAVIGDALAFAGAATVSGYLLLGRDARREVPAMVWAAGVYGVAAVLLGVWCLVARVPLYGYEQATWLAIAALVAGPQLLGHTVFNTLLGSVSATVVAVVVLAEPIGSGILAAWLLDELPAPAFWFGAPLVILGVYLAAMGERGNGEVAGTIDAAAATAAETGMPVTHRTGDRPDRSPQS